jgi:hypothetical protein
MNKNWLIGAAVLAVTVALHGCGAAAWPWDIDELSSLEELGLLDPSVHAVAPTPDSILVRLPRLIPVWYVVQGSALRVLPHDELGTRLLSVACGILTVMLAFVFAWRWRGLRFALALVVLMDGSQLMIWLSQQNRFYTMATLFLMLTVMAIWSTTPGWKMGLATAVATLLAVFSHNLLVVLFGMMLVVACAAYPLGWIPRRVLVRSAIAGVLSALVYVFYVRRVAGGWTGVGFAWTDPFRSFIAHVGVPLLALAGFGTAIGLLRRPRSEMAWWAGLAAGVVVFVALTPWIMPVWNPRYALLLVLPLWITAAFGMEWVARSWTSPWQVALWYGLVVVLLAPKLVSHYLDGTRHDYRQAAAVVAAQATPGQTILTNMELQTRYYLPVSLRGQVRYWQAGRDLPPAECIVVCGSNIWDPMPSFGGRPATVLTQVAKRRYDELSHAVRVYRVRAVSPDRRN